MAALVNQARLIYNNNRIALSNIATGDIVAPIVMTKTAMNNDYVRDDDVTYVVTIINLSSSALTNVTFNDNLGAYQYGDPPTTLYPLTFVGPVLYYINGIPQTNILPTETTPTLMLTIPNIPANANVTLVYEVNVNEYAPLDVDSTIIDQASITEIAGITATSTISVENIPQLAITKSISPIPVIDNQTAMFTFIIDNYGNTASTDAILTDTLSPILNNVAVTLNGSLLEEDADYTYEPTTGELATIAGRLTIPAATFSQDESGIVTTTPGSAILIVTGIV